MNVPWTNPGELIDTKNQAIEASRDCKDVLSRILRQGISDETWRDCSLGQYAAKEPSDLEDLSTLQPPVGGIREGNASVDLALSMHSAQCHTNGLQGTGVPIYREHGVHYSITNQP